MLTQSLLNEKQFRKDYDRACCKMFIVFIFAAAFGLSISGVYYGDHIYRKIMNGYNVTTGVFNVTNAQNCNRVADYTLSECRFFRCVDNECSNRVCNTGTGIACNTVITFTTETNTSITFRQIVNFVALPTFNNSIITVVYNKENPRRTSVYRSDVLTQNPDYFSVLLVCSSIVLVLIAGLSCCYCWPILYDCVFCVVFKSCEFTLMCCSCCLNCGNGSRKCADCAETNARL